MLSVKLYIKSKYNVQKTQHITLYDIIHIIILKPI